MRPFKITSELFFSENNQYGYSTKDEFKAHIEALKGNPFWIKELETLFQCMSERHSITSIIRTKILPNGMQLAKFTMQRANHKITVDVSVFGKLLDFINDYRLGRISPSVALDELIHLSQQ